MNYLMLENGIISNIIVAEPDVAEEFGALPYYDGAAIGDPYDPPHIDTEIELAQQGITDQDLARIEQGQGMTGLELSGIEQGQAQTDLELMILEGQAHV